jgi:hypothetical protein
MIDVGICSETKQDINSEVHISDLRCTKGVGVSFWDPKVCKKSLRDFLRIFLVLKVHYEGLKVCDDVVWFF